LPARCICGKGRRVLVSLVVNLLLLPFLPWRLWRRSFAAPKDAVITLTIKGRVEEVSHPRRWSLWQRLSPSPQTFSLHRFCRVCRALSEDQRVRGLRLRLEPFQGGWAAAEGLREAVAAVAAKKTVWCELPKGGGLKEYFVASAAHTVALGPSASLRLVGLGGRGLYFQRALELARIDVEVERRHEWKSAAEPFSRAGMSEPARSQLQTLLGEIKTRVLCVGKTKGLLANG
jgi:protease-4